MNQFVEVANARNRLSDDLRGLAIARQLSQDASDLRSIHNTSAAKQVADIAAAVARTYNESAREHLDGLETLATSITQDAYEMVVLLSKQIKGQEWSAEELVHWTDIQKKYSEF